MSTHSLAGGRAGGRTSANLGLGKYNRTRLWRGEGGVGGSGKMGVGGAGEGLEIRLPPAGPARAGRCDLLARTRSALSPPPPPRAAVPRAQGPDDLDGRPAPQR